MTKEKAAELISENLKTVYAWALSRVSDKYDAEDLSGDIVNAALENAEKLRDDRAFYGWFWQIAKNTYKTYLTKKSKNTAVPLDGKAENIADSTQTDERAAVLRREIAFLSENYRKCTVDYYFNDLSVKEISEKYGISRDMVKYYLFKTRKILKEGIPMEREFGEKSFNPSDVAIFMMCLKNVPPAYSDFICGRKLPAQIISSAYYSPMKLEELSVELGIPTVYLEDEVKLLQNYNLLREKNGKFRSNIMQIDIPFLERYYKKVFEKADEPLSRLCEGIKNKLPKIRETTFGNGKYCDELILWNALVFTVVEGYCTAQCVNFDNAYMKCGDDNGIFTYAVTGDAIHSGIGKVHLNFSSAAWWDSTPGFYINDGKVSEESGTAVSYACFNSHSCTDEKFLSELNRYAKDGFPSAMYSEKDYRDFIELMCPEIPLCADALKIACKVAMDVAEDLVPDGIELHPDRINAMLMHSTRELILSFAAEKCGFTVPDEPLAGTYFLVYEKK